MKSNISRVALVGLFLCAIGAVLPNAGRAADDLPAAAQVLDDKTLMYMRPVPLVSPDGRHVAYISRGYVCVADVAAGTSRRLAEVPDTWTHAFAKSEKTIAGGDPNSLHYALTGEEQKQFQANATKQIQDFQWTADSTAIVYGLSHYDQQRQATLVQIWRAPLTGEPKEIANGEISPSTRRGPGGLITRDGRFLVSNAGRARSLIWDTTTNKPRATPFLYLTPSPASDRWLGIEMNTRQLVVVDKDFQIIERHDEFLPKDNYGFDMIWSPDEKFVFWRQQIGYDYTSNWVGCRYDLAARDRQIFTGSYMRDEIKFTGNRGEFLRVGANGVQDAISGLATTEQYVGIVPDGRMHMQRFWWFRPEPPGMENMVSIPGSGSNVTWSPDLELFTIGLGRLEGPRRSTMHLADRHRHLWKFPGKETEKYVSPYHIAGFALDGQSIIAYDETRLFVLPVDAVRVNENKVR
jgi:hypothetical protein